MQNTLTTTGHQFPSAQFRRECKPCKCSIGIMYAWAHETEEFQRSAAAVKWLVHLRGKRVKSIQVYHACTVCISVIIPIQPKSAQSRLWLLLASTCFCWNHKLKCSTWGGYRSKQSFSNYHQYATLTRPNKAETAVCGSFHLCLLDDWGGYHWLP